MQCICKSKPNTVMYKDGPVACGSHKFHRSSHIGSEGKTT